MSSLAGVHVVDPNALLTANIAAPVENAVALLLSLFGPCVVTSAAAEEVTPIYAMGCEVAGTITGAKGARLRIGVTEIG